MIQTRNIPVAQIHRAAEVLKTIGHPVRLRIVQLLEVHERLGVNEMLEDLDIAIEQSMLSHHLIKMKDKGVLQCEKVGTHVFYSLKHKNLSKIFDCMEACDFF